MTDIDVAHIPNSIVFEASVNPGNSGGPVLNAYGQVVGVVGSKDRLWDDSVGASVTAEGRGHATPIKDLVAHLAKWTEADASTVDCSQPYYRGYQNNLAGLEEPEYWVARQVYLIGAGLNDDNYPGAFGRFSPSEQGRLGGLDAWQSGHESTDWTALEVESVEIDGTEAVVVASIETEQDGVDGFEGQTCSIFHNRYRLVRGKGRWLISAVEPLGDPIGC